jgi:general secretion pathway protein C
VRGRKYATARMARRSQRVAHVNQFRIAGALCVVVCASFAARAAAQVIEGSYFADATVSSPPTVAPPPRTVTPPRAVDPDTLTSRNPFCSDCGPPPVAGDPTPVAQIQLPLVLVATNRGAVSFATMRNTETDAQGAYAVGAKVPGAGVVERIGATYVEIRTDQGLARVALMASTPDEPTAAPTKTSAPAVSAWADKVNKIDDSTYEVDRSLVRDLMAAQGKTPGVRVGPAMKDGRIAGLRVQQARADSLATAIGLRQGDTINGIDGNSLDTADAMLNAYRKLDSASSVRVSLTRAGKPLELDYRLR